MKFWTNLIETISNQTRMIIKASAELLQSLKSIDNKLNKTPSLMANDNPVKDVSITPIQILDEDNYRTKVIIQNIGLEPCYIKLGNGISKDNFHFTLAPDTSPAFGNGGSVTLDNWYGEIYAISNKTTKISVLEY